MQINCYNEHTRLSYGIRRSGIYRNNPDLLSTQFRNKSKSTLIQLNWPTICYLIIDKQLLMLCSIKMICCILCNWTKACVLFDTKCTGKFAAMEQTESLAGNMYVTIDRMSDACSNLDWHKGFYWYSMMSVELYSNANCSS